MFPIDSFRATIAKLIAILDEHAIAFHLTGGITSVAYCEPRMTQDVDFVIHNGTLAENLDQFLASLNASDFLFDADAVRDAQKNSGLFQLLDTVESLKLDVYARELIEGELSRSVQFELFDGLSLPIASRPDVAVSKLIWVSKGSHKSRRDLRQILRTAGKADCEWVRERATELQLITLLDEVLAESDELDGVS